MAPKKSKSKTPALPHRAPSAGAISSEAIIAEAGAIAERYGLTRIAGELATLLFLTPGPLSIGEMATRLSVTKPSVSTNIRFLERWRVVRKTPVRGDRRDYYEFSGDLWSALREAFEGVIVKDAGRLTELFGRVAAAGPGPVAERARDARELVAAVAGLAGSLFAGRPAAAGEVREIEVE